MKLPSITRRAAKRIGDMTEKLLPEELKREDYIAVVMWMSDSTEIGFAPGPEIGAHKRSEIPQEYIVDAHGVRIAYGLPADLIQKYQDSTLDFIEGRFLFVDETTRKFIGADSQ